MQNQNYRHRSVRAKSELQAWERTCKIRITDTGRYARDKGYKLQAMRAGRGGCRGRVPPGTSGAQITGHRGGGHRGQAPPGPGGCKSFHDDGSSGDRRADRIPPWAPCPGACHSARLEHAFSNQNRTIRVYTAGFTFLIIVAGPHPLFLSLTDGGPFTGRSQPSTGLPLRS